MTNRALFALLLGAAPIVGIAQLDAQPATNLANSASNGSNVASGMANDSVDADTPADTTTNTANTTDDGPPK